MGDTRQDPLTVQQAKERLLEHGRQHSLPVAVRQHATGVAVGALVVGLLVSRIGMGRLLVAGAILTRALLPRLVPMFVAIAARRLLR
jgi:uncharacterized protein YcfJ